MDEANDYAGAGIGGASGAAAVRYPGETDAVREGEPLGDVVRDVLLVGVGLEDEVGIVGADRGREGIVEFDVVDLAAVRVVVYFDCVQGGVCARDVVRHGRVTVRLDCGVVRQRDVLF